MTQFLIVSMFSIGICSMGLAEEPSKLQPHIPLFGHNLTPTTYTLNKNQTTLGNYVVGYGITDNLTVATSPWMIIGYNMPMIDVKYGMLFGENYRGSLEALYFKTQDYNGRKYDMEAQMWRLGGTHRFNDVFNLHGAIDYTYFYNDTKPFSLRLDTGYGNTDRYTLSAGVLFEIHLSEHVGMLQEVGTLGINYLNAYYQLGSSMFWRWDWGYFQFGYSQSSTLKKIGVNGAGESVYQTAVVWHPEIHLQFFIE